MRTVLVTAALVVAVVWIAAGVSTPGAAEAADAPSLAGDQDTLAWAAPVQVDGGADVNDDRVPVQLWTLLAAAGAAAVGLLALLLRIVMGWVKPPPAQEESPH